MSREQIAKAIDYIPEGTEAALKRLESAGKIVQNRDGHWEAVAITVAQPNGTPIRPIIGSGVFRNRSAGPLCAASSEAPHKRSLISAARAVLPERAENPTTPSNPSVDRNAGSGRLHLEKILKIISIHIRWL
jgi:hypothetical protein